MKKFAADKIYPVSAPPVKNGVVVTDDAGKILQVGEQHDFDPAELQRLHGIICPGFINAHCHLELSYMRGKMDEHTGLVNFLLQLLNTRNDELAGIEQAIEAADEEMYRNGVVAVGDISNRNTSFAEKKKSKLRYFTFVECFGLNAAKAGSFFQNSKHVMEEARRLGFPCTLTPHAPYSISNELLSLIFSFKDNDPEIFSYHNQESEEENKLFRGEANQFEALLSPPASPPERRHAGGSLQAHIGYFPPDKKTLFVHNTFTSAADVHSAMQTHPLLYWCFCPNANLYIENTLPHYQNFINYPDRLCIGTDSYASNHGLSVFEEMKTISSRAPYIGCDMLLQWATLNGATFFGWQDELGSIKVGKRPGLNLIASPDPDDLLHPEATVARII